MKTKTLLKTLLLVEDDELFRESVGDFLSSRYSLVFAETAEEGLKKIEESAPDLVLLDIFLPGMSGLEMLEKIKDRWPEIPVIMLTAMSSVSKVVQAIKLGAFDYLTKNSSEISEKLLLIIENALVASNLHKQLEQKKYLQILSNKEYKLIGNSPAMISIREKIEILGKTNTTVLIHGETGTGKELVARGIHSASARAEEPFVAINCGAIPKDLIESELFGYSKGAFTGASSREIGKFLLANNGTLLLDEVSELPMEAQTKLLRILEEQEFYPLGSSKLVRVDVRVIASTNMDLEEKVEKNTFRKDLFFRLNIGYILVPPLSKRPEDILALSLHFMHFYNQKFNKKFQAISTPAQEILLQQSWKGNVRELRNVIERVLLFEEGTEIQPEHLYFLKSSGRNPALQTSVLLQPQPSFSPGNLDDLLKEAERNLLLQALETAKGNKTKAAELLNLTRAAYCYRLGKYEQVDEQI